MKTQPNLSWRLWRFWRRDLDEGVIRQIQHHGLEEEEAKTVFVIKEDVPSGCLQLCLRSTQCGLYMTQNIMQHMVVSWQDDSGIRSF